MSLRRSGARRAASILNRWAARSNICFESMTLILSFATANKVIQVSDRRLTKPDGSLYDDEANKVICVGCSDSYFAIGYSGLGTISTGKRTDEWLVDYLASINVEQMTLNSIHWS